MSCCKEQRPIPIKYFTNASYQSFKPGKSTNFGLTNGRMTSYPIDYACFTKEDAEEMVRSGLTWYGSDDHAEVQCLQCYAQFIWRPGMNVDEEHRKDGPDCPWLARRDRGLDMELHVNPRLPLTLLMKYRADGEIDIVCIKCDVTFPYTELPRTFPTNAFGEMDRKVYKKMHQEYSPDCH
jgi:hypothetical protein